MITAPKKGRPKGSTNKSHEEVLSTIAGIDAHPRFHQFKSANKDEARYLKVLEKKDVVQKFGNGKGTMWQIVSAEQITYTTVFGKSDPNQIIARAKYFTIAVKKLRVDVESNDESVNIRLRNWLEARGEEANAINIENLKVEIMNNDYLAKSFARAENTTSADEKSQMAEWNKKFPQDKVTKLNASDDTSVCFADSWNTNSIIKDADFYTRGHLKSLGLTYFQYGQSLDGETASGNYVIFKSNVGNNGGSQTANMKVEIPAIRAFAKEYKGNKHLYIILKGEKLQDAYQALMNESLIGNHPQIHIDFSN